MDIFFRGWGEIFQPITGNKNCTRIQKPNKALYQVRLWEFPDISLVRTLCFHCRGLALIPGWGTKIPQAAQHGKKKKPQQKTVRFCPAMLHCLKVEEIVIGFGIQEVTSDLTENIMSER